MSVPIDLIRQNQVHAGGKPRITESPEFRTRKKALAFLRNTEKLVVDASIIWAGRYTDQLRQEGLART